MDSRKEGDTCELTKINKVLRSFGMEDKLKRTNNSEINAAIKTTADQNKHTEGSGLIIMVFKNRRG